MNGLTMLACPCAFYMKSYLEGVIEMKKIIILILAFTVVFAVFPGCAKNDSTLEEISTRDNGLIEKLVDYLVEINTNYELTELTLKRRINQINNGKQALLASFDMADSYFVCGYYSEGHENEKKSYCCADKYTWVKTKYADCIPESYNGSHHIVSFQLNRASSVENIISATEKAPALEHFQIYKPEFKDGLNIKSPLSFNTRIISIADRDIDTVYISTSSIFFNYYTIPCEKLGKKIYITQMLYVEKSDGTRSENDVSYDLGEYYDALSEIMLTEHYVIPTGDGRSVVYGLFEIDDFVKAITEK